MSIISLSELTKTYLNIRELLINKPEHIIYLTTTDLVLQINLTELIDKTCQSYKFSCYKCSKDPLCHWNHNASECVQRLAHNTQTTCSTGSNELEVYEKTSNLSLSINNSLILECSQELSQMNKKLELSVVEFSRRITWYKNGVELESDGVTRFDKNGDLIILNLDQINSTANFSCKFDDSLVLFVNLTWNDHLMNDIGQLLTNEETTMETFEKVFESWRMEIQEFNMRLHELNDYFNTTMCY